MNHWEIERLKKKLTFHVFLKFFTTKTENIFLDKSTMKTNLEKQLFIILEN